MPTSYIPLHIAQMHLHPNCNNGRQKDELAAVLAIVTVEGKIAAEIAAETGLTKTRVTLLLRALQETRAIVAVPDRRVTWSRQLYRKAVA